MNFDSFLEKYGIGPYTQNITIERIILLNMLEDLYTEGYNDGATGEKLIRLETMYEKHII